MSICPGKIEKRPGQHAGQVFRCSHCGAVGCIDQRCSNYNFTGSVNCLKCGKFVTKKSI